MTEIKRPPEVPLIASDDPLAVKGGSHSMQIPEFPKDRLALERLHQETGMDIFPILVHPQELQTALKQLV